MTDVWWKSQWVGVLIGAVATFVLGTLPTAIFSDRRAAQDREAAERRWVAELNASDSRTHVERQFEALRAFAMACHEVVELSSRVVGEFDYLTLSGRTWDRLNQSDQDRVEGLFRDTDRAFAALEASTDVVNSLIGSDLKTPRAGLRYPRTPADFSAVRAQLVQFRSEIEVNRGRCHGVATALSLQIQRARSGATPGAPTVGAPTQD